MKRILLIAFAVASISTHATFASLGACVDLSSNLSRGKESSLVNDLQNFLSRKGFLMVQPNGYFGPSTERAVKAYQKSAGIIQTGAVFSLTRAAIKKETCGASSVPSLTGSERPSTPSATSSVHPQIVATPSPVSALQYPVPQPLISSIDKATFVSKATMDAPLTIHGTNFSTSSNTLLLKLQGSNRTYTIGTVASSDGVTITASSSFTATQISCGSGCADYLPVGNYDVVVKNQGGESNTGYISIKSVMSSSSSGSLQSAIPSGSLQTRLGTITFGASFPATLENITFNLVGEGFDVGGIRNLKLKDDTTGVIIEGSGTFDLNHQLFFENQSKIYTVYGDVNVPTSGQVSVDAIITVKDFIGNNLIHVTVPTFMATISGHY